MLPDLPTIGPAPSPAATETAAPQPGAGGVVASVPGAQLRQAEFTTDAPDVRAAAAIRTALAQIGLPYVWGGNGPTNGDAGFDCSGLTTFSYASAGVSLPRTAHTQYNAGPHVPDGAPLQPGDLVFYGTTARVHHVGMYLGAGRMVNAPTFGKPVQVAFYRYRGDDYLGATRPAAVARLADERHPALRRPRHAARRAALGPGAGLHRPDGADGRAAAARRPDPPARAGVGRPVGPGGRRRVRGDRGRAVGGRRRNHDVDVRPGHDRPRRHRHHGNSHRWATSTTPSTTTAVAGTTTSTTAPVTSTTTTVTDPATAPQVVAGSSTADHHAHVDGDPATRHDEGGDAEHEEGRRGAEDRSLRRSPLRRPRRRR